MCVVKTVRQSVSVPMFGIGIIFFPRTSIKQIRMFEILYHTFCQDGAGGLIDIQGIEGLHKGRRTPCSQETGEGPEGKIY
jgi:hypothetical protein